MENTEMDKMHALVMACNKPLPAPDNGMDTKELLQQAHDAYKREDDHNEQEFAQFKTAYTTALKVLSDECTPAASAPPKAGDSKADLERRIKMANTALKYATTAEEKAQINRRIKTYKLAQKYN